VEKHDIRCVYAARPKWSQLKELTFGEKTTHLGLRAADVMAYRLRQLFQNHSEDGLDFDIKDYDMLLFKHMSIDSKGTDSMALI
jgi:hypothetical protein